MHTKLPSFSIETFFTRLLTSWIFISLLNSLSSTTFLQLEFCAEEGLVMFLFKVLLCFLLFTIMNTLSSISLDIPLLLFGTLLYSFRVLTASSEVSFLFAVCLFTAFVLYYLFPRIEAEENRFHLPSRTGYTIVIAAALFLFLYICTITISRYCLSRSSTFDMGIFIQMFHTMKENFTMYTSCERNEWMSHSSVHTSLFFYLLLPFYCLFPYAQTLLILQAGAVLLGFLPLLLLCRHFQLSPRCTMVFCLIYGLSPATTGGCFYDFHENVFLIPLLLFLFYFYEKKYLLRMLMLALLVCSVKEDAALFVLVFGCYVLIGRRDVKYALPLLGIGSIWMSLAFTYLSIHGQGLMTNHYSNLVCDADKGLLGILQTLVTNPAYLLTQMFTEDKLEFAITMFLPLTILPFYTRKYSRLLLLIPFLFINLLPSYTYQHSVFYQYVFGPYMFLLYMSLLNLRELKKKPKHALLLLCLCFSFYAFTSQIGARRYYFQDYRNNSAQRAAVQEMLSQIPDNASVSASTFFVPQLAQRKTIYMVDGAITETQTIYETDYAVFDLRDGFSDEKLGEEIQLYIDHGYTTLEEHPGVYVILKRP